MKLEVQPEINRIEHEFYREHTSELKHVPTINSKFKGLIDFNPDELNNFKATHEGVDRFKSKVYDFQMGKYLAEEGIRLLMDKNQVSREEAISILLDELEQMAVLREIENSLFISLAKTSSSENEEVKKHLKATEREKSSAAQIIFYLSNIDRERELVEEASHYQKYLKYKQKYIALKKQFEQKKFEKLNL